MKFLFISLGLLVLIFTVLQLYFMSTQDKIESYPYTVIESHDGFEIRAYEASLFTSVKLSTGEYESASSNGFSILAGYIFGGNKENEKIAMTSPVAMSLEDSITMMFMVPKKYNLGNLPEPNRQSIEFREEPAKVMAALRFGGWANNDRIEKYKDQLKEKLTTQGISFTNRFYFFGYNPPYEVVNRKNEIIVELESNYKGKL